ncbi:phosphatase PAP2 family protein [Stakelama sp. CBK3Z-3]|uniref:Phosphatase PAP2 family protein n=1 Tax=Stakelama flava TaxID=2860338 RepID=A0ABS6XM03_9SPHN|nr:phosphatase PAP2 family protein [Stakelama flava]MBW4331210.1 phosphatase PAP2 family protein [Stakelama flava]
MTATKIQTAASDPVRQVPHLFWGAGFAAASVAVLLVLGFVINPAQPYAFDAWILRALRHPDAPAVPMGPVWLKGAMIDITALGGGTVLTLVVLITVGMLLVSRKWTTALLVAAGTVSGSLAVSTAKEIAARPRPEVVPHLVEVTTQSFPSGHSANSAIIYLTIATLLTQTTGADARRTYLFAVVAALVTLIGVSRVYLGVHWPTDVLAGWSFGTLWALAWWRIGKWLRIHHHAAIPDDEIAAL